MTARHGLPHPLAILYDRLNQHEPREQWAELLRFAEGAARFLAWVLVAEAAARGAGADRLRRQLTAASFGAFLHVIGQDLKERRARPDAFLRELDAFVNAPAWAALQAFGALRNDAAHHRLPTTAAAARALLDAHRGALQDLLDGLGLFTRYPLGVLRGAQVTTGGAVTARWFACRGLSMRSGNVEVYGVGALPTEQVLLIDPEARLALTLAPLFVCDEQAFAWLDLPVGGATGRAGVYARPTPGEAPMAGAPEGLVDVTGAAPRGLTLDAWLGDPRQRPRLVGLQLDEPSLRAVTQSAAPTQALEAQAATVAAAAVIGGDGATTSAARRAVALPPTRVSEMPYAPTVLMTATTSATSVPPTATAREVRPAARRWAPPAWVVGLGVGLAIGGVVVGWSARSRGSEPTVQVAAATTATVATAAFPAPPGQHGLDGDPALRRWVDEWLAALPVGGVVRPALAAHYAASVRFHGMSHDQGPDFIVDRWHERLWMGSFSVDLPRSTWAAEATDASTTPAACRAVAGASGAVTVVRLEAVEVGAPDGAALAVSGRCRRRGGYYLLRLRALGAERRICHETWRSDVRCTP